MQDLRSIPGGATGRLFGVPGAGGGAVSGGAAGAVGALERRLRLHPQQNLRCPRCDSLNTKFCYYNNYNLSQPRHFCKSCRRYWTNGGVLRNVPVGGGCRKSKRSSSSSSSSSSPSSKSSKSSSQRCKGTHHRVSPAAASSSDSAPDGPTVTQEPNTTPQPPALDSYATALLLDSISEGGAEPPTATGIFPETGSFTSLVAAAGSPTVMGLNFTGVPQLHLLPVQQPKETLQQSRIGMAEEEMTMPEIPLADMDVVPQPTLQGRSAAGPALAAFDWPGCLDTTAGLFDVAGGSVAGDHGGYWNQCQWGEIDPSLFLP